MNKKTTTLMIILLIISLATPLIPIPHADAGSNPSITLNDPTLDGLAALNEDDPGYVSLNNPTVDGMAEYDEDNSHGSGYSVNTVGNTNDYGEDTAFENERRIAYFEWSLVDLPADVTITNVVFKYDCPGRDQWGNIYEMEKRPSTSSAETIYNDALNGTIYVTVASETFPLVDENQEIDLGSDADDLIQTRPGWFAIGCSPPSFIDGDVTWIYSEDDATPVPSPTLYIEYTLNTEYEEVTDGNTNDYGEDTAFVFERRIAYFEWNISALPADVTITDVFFKYHCPGRDQWGNIYEMEKRPSTSSAETIYNDALNGTIYVTVASETFPLEGESKEIDLGPDAVALIQSRPEWFAIGCSPPSFIDGNITWIYSEDYESAVPKPTLYIEYTMATITFDFDVDDWVFEGKKRYNFQVTWLSTTLSTIKQVGLRFTDDINEIHTIWYDKDANTLTVTSLEDGISGWLSSIEQTGANVNTTFQIMFNSPIPDTYDVQAQVRLITNTDTGWIKPGGGTFNIYNLGGLTELTYSGYSGRRSGGDAFEIYAADALVAILANENFETTGKLVYKKAPFFSGSPLLRIEFDSVDWEVNEAPPFLNVTIIDEYINADSRPYAYTGNINTPTWRDGDQCLHVDTATVSNGYPSAFKRFRRPITNTSEVQELITATVFWQGGLSGGVNTTTSHIKISDLPTTQSASNTAVDIQLESILDPGGAGHVRVRDGATQKVAAIGGDAINWEVHNWYNVTIQVNITDQTWSLMWDGSATNATDIDFFENTGTLEWFGVVGANGLGGGEAVDFYIDALKVTTDYDEDLAGDVTAKTAFNMLQHWSMDFDWDVEDGYVTSDYANLGFIELGWDICLNGTWVNRALWARINITNGAVPELTQTIYDILVKNQNWVEFNIEWYEQDSLIKTNTLYGLYEGYKIEPTPGQKDVIGWHWDMWFNKMDASTWIGGRINTEWFGMSDKSIPWMIWTSNWKPMVSDETESTVFARLKDGSDNIKSAKLVTLVRPWVRVTRTKDYTFHYEIKNIQGLNFITAKETMSGIDTPAIRPTQAPFIMGGFFGSFLGAIFTAGLKRLANALSGFGLSFFTLSIDFIENVFSALGYPGLVSSIFSWMGTLFDSVPTLVGFALTFIGDMFSLINTSASDVLTQFTSIVTIWVSMYANFKDLLDGALTPGINLWTDLGLNSFVQIGAVLYPMWLIIMWSDKGGQAVIDHLSGILSIGSFFLNFILNVSEFFIGLLKGLIGAIRG